MTHCCLVRPVSSKGEFSEIPLLLNVLMLCASVQPLSGEYGDVELYTVDAIEHSPSLGWGDLLFIALMSSVDYNVSCSLLQSHLIDGAPRVYRGYLLSVGPIWVQKDSLPGSGHESIR